MISKNKINQTGLLPEVRGSDLIQYRSFPLRLIVGGTLKNATIADVIISLWYAIILYNIYIKLKEMRT